MFDIEKFLKYFDTNFPRSHLHIIFCENIQNFSKGEMLCAIDHYSKNFFLTIFNFT